MRRAQQPFSVVAALAAVALTAAACATIMHGSSQEIGIASQPTGAKIRVDNRDLGVTPLTAKLSRKDVHTISISMAGYQPYELTTTRHTSGWVWGNIVFGGLIGLAVDAITGGLYAINPEQVQGQLAKLGSSARLENGALYVILVPRPDPSWPLIGQLEPVR